MKCVFRFQYSILFKQEHGELHCELVCWMLFRIFFKVLPSAIIKCGDMSVFLCVFWSWTPACSTQCVVSVLSPRWRHLDSGVGQEWSRRVRNHRHWFTGRHGQSLEMASVHILIRQLPVFVFSNAARCWFYWQTHAIFNPSVFCRCDVTPLCLRPAGRTRSWSCSGRWRVTSWAWSPWTSVTTAPSLPPAPWTLTSASGTWSRGSRSSPWMLDQVGAWRASSEKFRLHRLIWSQPCFIFHIKQWQ